MQLPPGDETVDLGFAHNILEEIERLTAKYGNTFKVYSPTRKAYTFVSHEPDHVAHLLVKNNRNYTKGVGIERVKLLLGNGIMVSEGSFWKRQRRMIQPAFHRKVIENMSLHMQDLNADLLRHWSEQAQAGKQVNVTQEMSVITLEVVLRALFSKDLIHLKGSDNPFALLTQESGRDLSFAMKFRQLTALVKKVKVDRERDGRVEADFLSMLMETRDKETGKGMTEKELLDEVMTLIVAGHETTASVLNFAWFLIAKHPEVEERLLEEMAFLDGRLPDFEDIPRLNYTKQVLQEAMRLYPPGWMLTRRAIASDKLGSYEVPAGSDVFIIPYLIHRREDIWEQPESFLPGRFAPERERERHKFAYFPFAAGPRQCIGDFFAMVEMQLHLASVLPALHLRRDEALPELEPQINLRTRKDLLFGVEQR